MATKPRFQTAETVLCRHSLAYNGDDDVRPPWLSGTNIGEEPIIHFERYLVVEEDPDSGGESGTILHTTDDLEVVREIVYDAVMGEYYWTARVFDLDQDGAEIGWDISITLRTP